jgi:hypothetical protein
MGKFILSGNLLVEAAGEDDVRLQIEGTSDFYITGH